MEQPLQSKGHRPLIHRLSLQWLVIVPLLLAVAIGLVFFQHSDYNIPALYSQCHARSRLPAISHIPVIGAPCCFIVSFFQTANASVRSFARMSVILSFLGALLSISLVESARICNKPSRVISKPTLPWLVFNLIGGALVWDLVIVPSFLSRAKEVQMARKSQEAQETREADPEIDKVARGLSSQVEAWAIPIAVAVGFVVPSVLMLVFNHPVAIVIWLFFPFWVALVRHAVKLVAINLIRDPEPYYIESHKAPLIALYAIPVVCSVLAHGLLIWNIFSSDDRREMTRATIKFIEIDVSIIGVTVLYWLLVEAGVIVTLAMIVVSILLGPGAGLCGAWVLREKAIERYPCRAEATSNSTHVGVDSEETPLLRS